MESTWSGISILMVRFVVDMKLALKVTRPDLSEKKLRYCISVCAVCAVGIGRPVQPGLCNHQLSL